MSSYLWIAAWIAFWIAYSVNQFLRIAYGINLLLRISYGVNLFLGIGVCRIADCWLDRTSFELFYRFCNNACSNSSLVFLLWFDSDGGLKQSIRSNVIDVILGIFFFLLHDFDDSISKLFTGKHFTVTFIIVLYMVHHLRKVFFFWSDNVHSFVWHVKSV